MVKRGSGRSRQRVRARNAAITRYVHRNESGVKFTPSADPPEYSRAPWLPLTVSYTIRKKYSFTAKDIIGSVLSHLYMHDPQYPKKETIVIRMQSVQIWGMAKQAISLNITEIIGSGHLNLRQFSDVGSGSDYSRIGFRYGTVSRIDPINYDYKPDLFDVGGGSVDQPILVYVQILFCAWSTLYAIPDLLPKSLFLRSESANNTDSNPQDHWSLSKLSIKDMP